MKKSVRQLFLFNVGLKFGLVNKKGEVVLSPQYKKVAKGDGYVSFYDSKKGYIYIDLFDETATPQTTIPNIEYKIIEDSPDSPSKKNDSIYLKPTQKGGRWGYVDPDGNESIPFIYQNADSFDGGYARVQQKGLFGYIDRIGKVVMPLKFREVHRLTANLFFTNNTMVVDINGNVKYEVPNRELHSIRSNAFVYADTEWKDCGINERCATSALYNERGERIMPCEYSFFECYECDNLIRVLHHDDNKKGVLDLNGTPVLAIEYDEIVTSLINEAGFILAKKGRKWQAYSVDGSSFAENK